LTIPPTPLRFASQISVALTSTRQKADRSLADVHDMSDKITTSNPFGFGYMSSLNTVDKRCVGMTTVSVHAVAPNKLHTYRSAPLSQ